MDCPGADMYARALCQNFDSNTSVRPNTTVAQHATPARLLKKNSLAPNLLIRYQMLVPDCALCFHLLGNVSVTSTRHLKAMSELDAAVKKDPADARIAGLQRLVDACSIERQESVDQFRIHRLSHEQRMATAGAC